MLADKDMNEGKTAYVTHFKNPGIHELNLETKSYTRFINFTSYNCSGTYGIAYNSYSGYLYVDCVRDYRSISLIQMSIKSSVFINWGFAGSPLVSPNGRYVVVLYRSKTNSRMKILAVKKPTSTEDLGDISIPGGVSHAVFYPKGKNPDSYYAFVTLDYSNKMAVVDFDLVKNGSSPVTYIENVGELDTSRHGASRDLFISGKWIISPATKSKTVVIIDAEARKVHGKVSDVNEGDFAVWVPGMGPSSGTSGMSTGPSGTSGIAGMAGSRSLFVFLFGFLLLSN